MAVTRIEGRARAKEFAMRLDLLHVAWAALGGLAASLVIGFPMHALGMMVMGPAALVGSANVWVGWAVHLVAGVVFGSPYGLVVHSRRIGRGALYGLAWGAIVGIVFAWWALFTILGMPLLTWMAAMDVGLHLVWGLVAGAVGATGLRLTRRRSFAPRADPRG